MSLGFFLCCGFRRGEFFGGFLAVFGGLQLGFPVLLRPRSARLRADGKLGGSRGWGRGGRESRVWPPAFPPRAGGCLPAARRRRDRLPPTRRRRVRLSAALRSSPSSRSHAASSPHCRSKLSSATSTTISPSRSSSTISRFATIFSISGWLAAGRSSQRATRRIGWSLSGLMVASHGMNAAWNVSSTARAGHRRWCEQTSTSVCTTRRSRPSTRSRPPTGRGARRVLTRSPIEPTRVSAKSGSVSEPSVASSSSRSTSAGSMLQRSPAAVARPAGPVMTSLYPAGAASV